MARFVAAEKIGAGSFVYIAQTGMDGDGNRVAFVRSVSGPPPGLAALLNGSAPAVRVEIDRPADGDRPRILPDDLWPGPAE